VGYHDNGGSISWMSYIKAMVACAKEQGMLQGSHLATFLTLSTLLKARAARAMC
jgi:hypothetical protein